MIETLRSDLLRTLVERQFLHQCTDLAGLDKRAMEAPVTGYIGFDCTAPSLHVGSLVQIMMLRIMQRTGHKPIVLMGGGTTKVGDPSFRDTSRPLLDDAQIAANMAGIKQVFSRFVRFGDGPTDAVMVNNADWLDGLAYIPFLRDYGRHFSVNRMLSFESVKLRLEESLSFLEFNYMILQAYDFLELSRRFNCLLQMGGSDQYGNIINGIELARRVDDRACFGLTSPLITLASGAKMGKTAQGAVWLNPDMLSPYDYWQFWRNTDDADVGRFLRLFTDLPLGEIARLEALQGQELNEAKKILATAATGLCHGEDVAGQAAETARATFEQGRLSTDLPTVEVERARLAQGMRILELAVAAGVSASNGEARRLIRNRGLAVNDEPVADETSLIGLDRLTTGGVIKLSAGKKRHVLIRPV